MKTLLFILLITVSLYSCEKDELAGPTTGKVTFYTTVGGSWNLLIDGSDKGEITQALFPPLCDQDVFITLNLSIGKHTYDMKSNDGLAWGDPKEFQVTAGCTIFRALY